MRNGFVSRSMWLLFAPAFRKQLPLLGGTDGRSVMKAAKKKYRSIIKGIRPFGKNDILLGNLLSAAQAASVALSLETVPSCEQLRIYYGAAMDGSRIMRVYLKSLRCYSARYRKKLAGQAERSRLSDNPYSWRFRFYPGGSPDSYDAIFDRCGICCLFRELGISDLVPALCAYDYGMAKWTDTVFTRETTLASGGAVCDCHYKKRSAGD